MGLLARQGTRRSTPTSNSARLSSLPSIFHPHPRICSLIPDSAMITGRCYRGYARRNVRPAYGCIRRSTRPAWTASALPPSSYARCRWRPRRYIRPRRPPPVPRPSASIFRMPLGPATLHPSGRDARAPSEFPSGPEAPAPRPGRCATGRRRRRCGRGDIKSATMATSWRQEGATTLICAVHCSQTGPSGPIARWVERSESGSVPFLDHRKPFHCNGMARQACPGTSVACPSRPEATDGMERAADGAEQARNGSFHAKNGSREACIGPM
jgi:hypothetical protein